MSSSPTVWRLLRATIVGAGLILGLSPVLTPPVEAGFAVQQAVEHVAVLAREPHPMATPASGRVREYLTSTLEDFGLRPEVQAVDVPDYYGDPDASVVISNVMARIDGVDGRRAVLLVAHYDTVHSTPGANDNSAAVAALLETARMLVDQPPPNDVILLFTDGEEPTPRFGASAFTDHPWFREVALVVNFEGIGVAGPALLVEMSGPADPLAGWLSRETPHPPMFSFLTKVGELIGGAATDFDVFRDRAVPGFNFAYLRGSSIYHTNRDVESALNVGGMAHQAELALGIASHGGLPAPESGEVDAVFFTIPGWIVVRYGDAVALAGAVLTGLVLGWALVRRVRRRQSSVGRLVAGAGLVVGVSLVAVLATTIVWMGVVAIRADMGVLESYVWMSALIGGLGLAWHLARRRSLASGADVDAGAILVWSMLAIASGLFLPAVSYLFFWPALAGATVLGIGRLARTEPGRTIAVAVVTFPAAIVLVPAIDTLFQLAGPRPGGPDSEMPAAAAAPLLLAMLGVALVAMTSRLPRVPGEPSLKAEQAGTYVSGGARAGP